MKSPALSIAEAKYIAVESCYTQSLQMKQQLEEFGVILEYIAVESCYAQSLWMKQQLEDFGVILDHIPLQCDNISAINLSKNLVMHSRTKHIQTIHHFLRDHVSKDDCCIEFVDSEHKLADIFTKPLARDMFLFIRNELGISDGSSIK